MKPVWASPGMNALWHSPPLIRGTLRDSEESRVKLAPTKEHISGLAMIIQPVVVWQLDFFVDGLLSLSTAVQSVRRCVDAIQ